MKYVFLIPLVVVFTICSIALYFAICTPALAVESPVATDHTPYKTGKHQFSILHHGAIE